MRQGYLSDAHYRQINVQDTCMTWFCPPFKLNTNYMAFLPHLSVNVLEMILLSNTHKQIHRHDRGLKIKVYFSLLK